MPLLRVGYGGFRDAAPIWQPFAEARFAIIRTYFSRLSAGPRANPLTPIQIRNRSGNGDDAIPGIRIDAKLGAGALEQVGRMLVQS